MTRTRVIGLTLALPCALLGTALAIGNGNVVATPPVTFILSTTGTGTTNATLQNTSAGGFTVALQRDAACDADVGFTVAGGTPFALAGNASKAIALTCTAAKVGIERCLIHAVDSNTLQPLADLLAVCERASTTTLTPATTTLAFGTVAVGDAAALPLAITNNGAAPITRLFFQTDELGDNFEIALPCNPDGPACDGAIASLAPGATTMAIVHCTPRSAGAHTAQLEIASDAGQHVAQRMTLTCTGAATAQPVLGVEPPNVEIATPTEVVSAVAHSTAYLTNLGAGTLLVTDLRPVDLDPGAALDWSFSLTGTCTSVPCSLGAGQQVAIDLAFDPSQIGARHASLLVSFHDTIDRTRSIPLTGIGSGATLQLFATSTALELGSIPLGKSSSATLHFANTGNRDTIAMVSAMPVGPYVLAPASMLTVTSTAIADLTATCSPITPGIAPTTITTSAADTISATSLVVALTCVGITTPLYTMPTALAFGEVRLDGGPITKTLNVLANTGQVTVTGAPHLETANANLGVGTPVPATSPTSFEVTVTPQTEGDLKNHVLVDDSVGDTLLVPISGKIVTASYTVAATLDVGTFCVGQPTASSNLALTSDGTATIGVMQPSVPATSGFDLGMTAPTAYPTVLAPAKAATIAVTPERQIAATTLTATLTWTTDVASAPTATTSLLARFIDSGGAIAPPTLDFGRVPVHLFLDDGQRVIIQNCNGSVLELDPPTIKAPFSIDSPNFPTTLEPNETATFSVGFHPTRVGDFADTLTISSPQLTGAPLHVGLFGTSVTETPPNMDAGSAAATVSSTTFYACSCSGTGDPRGAAPLVIALVLVIFRRRGGSS